jgi:hypothetical protein
VWAGGGSVGEVRGRHAHLDQGRAGAGASAIKTCLARSVIGFLSLIDVPLSAAVPLDRCQSLKVTIIIH